MKRFLSLLFTGLTTMMIATSGYAQDTLTVMSYNIYHAEHPQENRSTVQEIADFIADIDPDFVSLQEVDNMTARLGELHENNTFDLADSLAKLTKMNSYFGKALDFDGGGYGVAILSRKPFKSENIKLPNPREGEPRVLLSLNAEIDGGSSLIFGATHLDHQYDENRLSQVEMINQNLNREEIPIILAGDFNFDPGTEGYKMMQAQWIDTASGPEGSSLFTYPTSNPEKRIDYIWLSKSNDWKVLNYQTIDVDYSDHLPVVARLVLPKE